MVVAITDTPSRATLGLKSGFRSQGEFSFSGRNGCVSRAERFWSSAVHGVQGLNSALLKGELVHATGCLLRHTFHYTSHVLSDVQENASKQILGGCCSEKFLLTPSSIFFRKVNCGS